MHYQRLVFAAVAVSLAATGCGKGGGGMQMPPLSVDAAPAVRQNIATYISLDGQVAPLDQSILAFQQSGSIIKINVNIGDVARKGDLLAQIDPSTLSAQLSQAEAQAAQANAAAQGSVVGYPVQTQSNLANLQTAKASLDNAKLVYEQNKQLYKQGYVSQTTLQSSQASYVQAQQQYNSSVVGMRNDVVSAQNVKASIAQANAASAQAHVLSTQLSQTYLYAPYDGVISERLLDPGAYASPSQPILQISRVDTVWININVPDEDLAYVYPGKQFTFKTPSLPGRTFATRFQTVNAVPTSGTLSYLARLAFPNPGLVLRGGMLVTATIPKEVAPNAVVVPRSAIATSESGSMVYLVQGGKAVGVPVQVGVQTDTMSQVISPKVQPGAVVITTRPDALKDGSDVAVNPGAAAASPSPAASGKH